MEGSQQRGREAEEQALQYLQRQGLSLVARNQRYRIGELDLIMQESALLQPSTLVFVEVRFRRSARFGGAAASVTAHKQQRIIRAAQCFLLQHPCWQDAPCRFDVVALAPSTKGWRIDWHRNAFIT